MPITAEVLRKYAYNPMLIETGTHKGDACQLALDVGFEQVLSVELHDALYARCYSRFVDEPRVHVTHGATVPFLREIMPTIEEPVTFWLDAHPDHDSPVLRELAVLAQHPIKTHTILIDDVRLMRGHWQSVNEQQVIDAIKEVNPDYEITYDVGYLGELDIMVAKVPQ